MNLAQTAIIQEIENLKTNKIVREFVEEEAYTKIAETISSFPGRCCTVKAAKLITHKLGNEAILARWEQYVLAGYVGCIEAKYP